MKTKWNYLSKSSLKETLKGSFSGWRDISSGGKSDIWEKMKKSTRNGNKCINIKDYFPCIYLKYI